MHIKGSVALVTGANRGIGRAIARELLDRGAARVYAAARTPAAVDLPGVVPVALDITDPAQVAAAAELAADTTLLVNNAGIARFTRVVADDLADIREEMEVNYFGTLSMACAFAPVLRDNGGGAMLNVLSARAWLGMEHSNGYSASKAAAWALTRGLAVELAGARTQVSGLLLAGTDTDMTAGLDIPKNRPEDVAATALDGVEAGVAEIIADEWTAAAKAALSAPAA